jgi:hypothetical protein
MASWRTEHHPRALCDQLPDAAAGRHLAHGAECDRRSRSSGWAARPASCTRSARCSSRSTCAAAVTPSATWGRICPPTDLVAEVTAVKPDMTPLQRHHQRLGSSICARSVRGWRTSTRRARLSAMAGAPSTLRPELRNEIAGIYLGDTAVEAVPPRIDELLAERAAICCCAAYKTSGQRHLHAMA